MNTPTQMRANNGQHHMRIGCAKINRHLGHGYVIIFQQIPWEVINYPWSRYLLFQQRSLYFRPKENDAYAVHSELKPNKYFYLSVFSLPISFVMIERIYIICLIIIIKSEVWTITHCLGLGHETMVCAVCLSIFLVNFHYLVSSGV